MTTIRREKFVPGQYYHIYSRLTFNGREFSDPKNADRLALYFLIANSTNSNRIFTSLRDLRGKELLKEKIADFLKKGEKLVDVLCYVIMPDHYHLLLSEKKENGIYNFIHKCNTAIAKYINARKDRRGPLFEGRFKSKYIDTNEYLLHLSLYIHLNPLDFLVGKEWREHNIKNWEVAKQKLFQYPWSSLNVYLGNGENPIISGVKIITGQFDKKETYEKFLREWSESEFNQIKDFTIDYNLHDPRGRV